MMKFTRTLAAEAALLCLLFCCGSAVAQTTSQNAPLETITVTGARAVADAMDVIEKRYGVPIDYSDPIYASTVDTRLLYSSRSTRLGVPALIPRVRSVSIKYAEVTALPGDLPRPSCNAETLGCAPVNDWPRGGITALIQKVLNQYAADGGQVFGVRKLDMSYGPRWEVYPVKARNALGTFVPQTDFLGAPVRIPRQRRAPGDMIDLVARQLTRDWGRKFWVALAQFPAQPASVAPLSSLRGSRLLTARRVILDLLGPNLVLRMYNGPENGSFAINIVVMPYREPPRPPTPLPVPAKVIPAQPIPPSTWAAISRLPKGVSEIQGALAKAGYLQVPPTAKWDASAVKALRRFQADSGLPATGKFDIATAGKLLPFLPKIPARTVPAKPAMDGALAYWLGSTPDGRKEIAEALTKAGFYHGPVTGSSGNPAAQAALKVFQKANGLSPSGWFTYQTAEKLAPYLPAPKN